MGENVRGQALEIMATVWVVWLCQQAGLWGLASVLLLVFRPVKRVCLVPEAVWGLPASFVGAVNENICRLGWVLQQAGCWTLSGSSEVHARLWHRFAICHFKDALSLPGVSMKYLLLACWTKELYAQRRCCRVVEPGLQSKAQSRQNENPFAHILSCKDVSKSSACRLQCQCAVSKHNVGWQPLRQGGCCALAAIAGECQTVSQISAAGQMVWLHQRGHRDAQRVVAKVRRNAAVVLQHTHSQRGSSAPHERLLRLQQAQAHARPTKVGWHTFSPKNSMVRTTVEVVSLPCFKNHSDSSNHWLCSARVLHVFCTWFVNNVTEYRRKGDPNSKLAMLAAVFTLLGNSLTASWSKPWKGRWQWSAWQGRARL